MLLEDKMDNVPSLSSLSYKITNTRKTADELSKNLAELGSKLLLETLPGWMEGTIAPQEQDHNKATYIKIIKKEDGHIAWSISAEQIERMVRAYTPWPGTYTYWNNKLLKILKADVLTETTDKTPGTVYTSGDTVVIATKTNSIIPTLVQLAGKSHTALKPLFPGLQHY